MRKKKNYELPTNLNLCRWPSGPFVQLLFFHLFIFSAINLDRSVSSEIKANK